MLADHLWIEEEIPRGKQDAAEHCGAEVRGRQTLRREQEELRQDALARVAEVEAAVLQGGQGLGRKATWSA